MAGARAMAVARSRERLRTLACRLAAFARGLAAAVPSSG
jgi:hypothetical protein